MFLPPRYHQQIPALPQILLQRPANGWFQFLTTHFYINTLQRSCYTRSMAGSETSFCLSACFCLPSRLQGAAARKILVLPAFGLRTKAFRLPRFVGRRLCAKTSPEVTALFSCRSQNSRQTVTIFIHSLSGLDVGQQLGSVRSAGTKAAPCAVTGGQSWPGFAQLGHRPAAVRFSSQKLLAVKH